jgi:uncharacterized protein (TIGR01777 family)
MTLVLTLLLIQGVLGAVDTFWHHEMEAGLPANPGARAELWLHGAREAIYAVIFLSLGWVAWQGAWAWVLAALMAAEVVITLKDFLLEDRTRRLAPSERVLHTVMAMSFGVLAAVIAPLLAGWAQAPTGFRIEGHGWQSAGTTLFGLGVLAWAVRDLWAAATLKPATLAAPARASGRTVLVTGATGFIGGAVVQRLAARGDRLVLLSRDGLAARARFGPEPLIVEDLDQLPAELRLDAVVNLAGAPTVGGLWTARRRARLISSRVEVTRRVLLLTERLERRPAVLVNGSAVGFYGDRGDERLDETSGPRPGFMSELCRRWEEEAWMAEALGVRVVRLRFGLVFDWSGSVLAMLALPIRLGLGAILGTGAQWVSWIHREDAVRMIEAALDDPRWEGPVNAVAPAPATHAEVNRAIGRELGRPVWARIPAWPLRLVLGEMADLFLASQRVLPKRAEALGFVFARPHLVAALARPGRGPARIVFHAPEGAPRHA